MSDYEQRPVSLSWLIVSVRDVHADSDWFWDKKHHCCYGVPVTERKETISKSIADYYYKCGKDEEYYKECVRLPDYHDSDFLDTAIYLRKWCKSNGVLYVDDLEDFREVQASYWGIEGYENQEPKYRLSRWKA